MTGNENTLHSGARWEHFPHPADIGVRGVGPTLARAFEQAALALTAVITDPDQIRPEHKITIDCQAPDDELLLCEWLNAIIFEMATRHMLFSGFHVTLRDHQLHGELYGEAIDITRHHPAVEVKGATMTELKVHRQNGLYIAQCVVDV